MQQTHKIIAIDGFSSCGKSTLARKLAETLGYTFIDSGAMYRAVTLYFILHDVDFKDRQSLLKALSEIHIDIVSEMDRYQVFLNGSDVSEDIRQMDVSSLVSEVSAIREVREAMVLQQQQMGKCKSIVMDGRDIGTAVFPNAFLKIFMTASPDVRAQRRYQELIGKGQKVTMEEVVQNLAHRDKIDTTRKESPLIQAHDAVLLDNSELDRQQQLDFVLELIKERSGQSHS